MFNSFISNTFLIALFHLPTYYVACAEPVFRALNANGEDPDSVTAPIADNACERQALENASEDLETVWKSYITQRQGEWVVISGLAFTFVTACPAALQAFSIPGPVTRAFIFIAIFQAICTIACSMAHFIFFRTCPEAWTGRFVYVWFQENNGYIIAKPWAIFSLPAVALCWGAIAFFVALMSLVWYGQSANSTGSQTIGLAPQLIISMFCVADVASVFWIMATLIKVKRRVMLPVAGDDIPPNTAD